MITITDAATVKLRELITSQEQPDLYLRLFIAPGGCEGFSYGMAFDTERHEDDQVIERGGVSRPALSFSCRRTLDIGH